MNKVKYLYRKSRDSRRKDSGVLKKFKRVKIKDLFLELPTHKKMRPTIKYCGHYRNYDSKPLIEFIKSKIGQDWNDVYSEIVKKTPNKFRRFLDDDVSWIIKTPIYDDDYIPKIASYGVRYNICSDRLYIDLDNIIRYDSKDVLLKKSNKIIRKIKLQQIIDSENENQSSD